MFVFTFSCNWILSLIRFGISALATDFSTVEPILIYRGVKSLQVLLADLSKIINFPWCLWFERSQYNYTFISSWLNNNNREIKIPLIKKLNYFILLCVCLRHLLGNRFSCRLVGPNSKSRSFVHSKTSIYSPPFRPAPYWTTHVSWLHNRPLRRWNKKYLYNPIIFRMQIKV